MTAPRFGSLTNVLAPHSIASGVFDTTKAKRSKQSRYHSLMRGINVSSYSTFGNLNKCERFFALSKLELARKAANPSDEFFFEDNMDFAFGKAMETGIQNALLGKTKQETFIDMFMSWDMPLLSIHPKGYAKTFMDATLAIDKFYYIKEQMFEGWEIAWFNGKPAIELSFCIDLGNGYYYVGHADIVLYHPVQNRYKVVENKTTATSRVDEAMFKNSDQAVGYSVIVDSIAKDANAASTFEVFYLVYSAKAEAYELMEFTKSRSNRAAWLNTILMDYQRIELCKQTGIWPKRGDACYSFFRRCKFFEICDLSFDSFHTGGNFDIITKEELAKHKFDFFFTLQEIIDTQTGLLKNG